jgi:hypothetical protein
MSMRNGAPDGGADGVPRIRPVDPAVVPGDDRTPRERALAFLLSSLPVLLGAAAALVANAYDLAWWWVLPIGAGLGVLVVRGAPVARRLGSVGRARR